MNAWFTELSEVDRRKLIDELYILYPKKPAQKYDCDAGSGEAEVRHWLLTDNSKFALVFLLFCVIPALMSTN